MSRTACPKATTTSCSRERASASRHWGPCTWTETRAAGRATRQRRQDLGSSPSSTAPAVSFARRSWQRRARSFEALVEEGGPLVEGRAGGLTGLIDEVLGE